MEGPAGVKPGAGRSLAHQGRGAKDCEKGGHQQMPREKQAARR